MTLSVLVAKCKLFFSPFVATISDARVVMIETNNQLCNVSFEQAPNFLTGCLRHRVCDDWFNERTICGRQDKCIRVAKRRRVR